MSARDAHSLAAAARLLGPDHLAAVVSAIAGRGGALALAGHRVDVQGHLHDGVVFRLLSVDVELLPGVAANRATLCKLY